ncbi:hypothetical protein ASE77_17390 [Sphingomonas sp. Leaf226]|nr:hypothetical protein ASE77_17390 [Sphingomonas sp. Leaf226]
MLASPYFKVASGLPRAGYGQIRLIFGRVLRYLFAIAIRISLAGYGILYIIRQKLPFTLATNALGIARSE